MASISETNPTRFRKRILIKMTIDDRPRHKHQFGTLPYKEVLKRIIKWNKKKSKPATKAPAPLDSKKKKFCCTKKTADLVFSWTKGVTCIVLLFCLYSRNRTGKLHKGIERAINGLTGHTGLYFHKKLVTNLQVPRLHNVNNKALASDCPSAREQTAVDGVYNR